MTTVSKKIFPEHFDDVASGKKKFELRLNDFDIAEGDTLQLNEWDPATNAPTGRSLEKKVTYVLRLKLDELAKFNPMAEFEEKGIQVISLE